MPDKSPEIPVRIAYPRLHVLRERWPALTQLADALVASPDIGLDREEIEVILGATPQDLSSHKAPPER